jgi:hypothetical protein
MGTQQVFVANILFGWLSVSARPHDHANLPLPPRPQAATSAVLRVSGWNNHTYHHGIGDSWPCTSVSEPAGDMVCIAGDIKTAGFANCTTSGMSSWHVKGVPNPEVGYSGQFNMERLSGYCDFNHETFCQGTVPTSAQMKPSAPIEINGTLVLGVSCMIYGDTAPDSFRRQTNLEGYIATSTDGGTTWDMNGAEQGNRPFQGRLAAPMFLQQEMSSLSSSEGADPWIYAYFAYGDNASFWNNNDGMLLGRALTSSFARPGRPVAGTWSFFCGDQVTPRFCDREDQALPVFEYAKMTGENLVTYDAASGRYIFANYGFYRADTGQPYSWFHPLHHQYLGRRWSQLAIFESAQPWGPWALVHLVDDWRGENAGYTPTLPSAWLKYDVQSATLQVRCAFLAVFDKSLRSRMPSVPTPACLKRACVCPMAFLLGISTLTLTLTLTLR